jgi:hypothetical protein
MEKGFLDRMTRMMEENKDVMQWLAEGEPGRTSQHVKQYEQHVRDIFKEDTKKQNVNDRTKEQICVYWSKKKELNNEY